jgi:hypothetical protein
MIGLKNWTLSLGLPDSLYTDGLKQLRAKLCQKYNLDNISNIAYV